ncbi:MAG: outer membrane beta-barrel protein [Nitrospiraceae bacterium]
MSGPSASPDRVGIGGTGWRRTCLVAWSVLLLLPPRTGAAEEGWSTVVATKTSYTTDVFQFSSARRLALGEDPSQPTIVPLDKPSDVIVEPSVEVRRLFGTKTELSAKAHGFLYTEHSIFNHAEYRLQAKQELDRDTSLLLRYRYVPNLFLGPNFSVQTSPRSLQEERVSSNGWRAELERKLSADWTVALIGRYGLRLYNQPFAERDTTYYTGGGQVGYLATPWAKLTLAYLYERGLADGRGNLQLKDDVSYIQNFISFNTEFRLADPLFLDLTYVYRLTDFTSTIVGDSHRHRQDVTNQGRAELRYAATKALALSLSVQQTQRTSTASASGFNDTITSVGVQYTF